MTENRISNLHFHAVLILLALTELSSGVASAQPELDLAKATAAVDHLHVAETQLKKGQAREAAASISAALEVLREDPTQAIETYLLLGEIYQRRGEHELSLGALSQAWDASRRAFGLSSTDTTQVEILRKMADSTAAIGDSASAATLYRQANAIVVQAQGARSIEAHEATLLFAEWLSEHGMPGHAAVEYDLLARSLRSSREHDPLEVVRLFRRSAALSFIASAHAYRSDLGMPNQLINALEIAQPGAVVLPEMATARLTHSGIELDRRPQVYGCFDVDVGVIQEGWMDEPLLVAEILRDIGDWCVGLGIPQRFENAHLLSWDLLAFVEDGQQIREEWFAIPTAIYMPPMERGVGEPEGTLNAQVELSFTVKMDGSTGGVEVIASEPGEVFDKEAVRRIRRSKFRPSIVDGRFVSARTTMILKFGDDLPSAP